LRYGAKSAQLYKFIPLPAMCTMMKDFSLTKFGYAKRFYYGNNIHALQ